MMEYFDMHRFKHISPRSGMFYAGLIFIIIATIKQRVGFLLLGTVLFCILNYVRRELKDFCLKEKLITITYFIIAPICIFSFVYYFIALLLLIYLDINISKKNNWWYENEEQSKNNVSA